MTKGKIHSIETCGTVDGPGIRYVIFLKGCPLRCLYCHNPDSWDTTTDNTKTPLELMEDIEQYISYMEFSGGGITVSGGEPLIQSKFITELFEKCKAKHIHTCIDTSGAILNEDVKKAFDLTDLVMLDIKAFDKDVYKKLTSGNLDTTLRVLEVLKEKNIDTWIRYVLVPNLTDDLISIEKLANYLKDFPNVKRIDVLPFHKMGEYKWEELNLEYTLTDTEPPSKDLLKKAKEIFKISGKEIF